MTTLAEHMANLPPDATATAANAKAALPGLGVLRVSGEQARDFLHGQFTADLKRLGAGRGGLAAWCTPKGRVLYLLDVLNAGDEGWLLLAPTDEIPALLKRLRLYVLRAKVLIEDLREDWGVMGLAGTCVPAALDEAGVAVRSAETWLLRVAGEPALAYALGPQAALVTLWESCTAPAASAERWEQFEIDAGRPRIAGPLAERFLPQELDLERLQGVHFDKGCYPGQEIVARLKYRGQVKCGLAQARTNGPVAPGDKLYRPDGTASVGDVLRVAADGSTCRVLAVVDFDARSTPLHLRDAQGPALVVES
jgi:hypothetical protein